MNAYVDRPRPGLGYMLALILWACGILAVAIVTVQSSQSPYHSPNTVIQLWPLYSLVVAWGTYFLSKAFSTEYRIYDGMLTIKSGPWRRWIALSEITEAQEADFAGTFIVGRYANRIIGAVRLSLRRRQAMYLTPSDINRFVGELRLRIKQQQTDWPGAVIE